MTEMGFFKPHGSADEEQIEITGNEFRKIMGYFTTKWALALAITFSIISGIFPLSMNLVMGDMMNVVSVKGFSDKDLNRVILLLAGVFLGWSILATLTFGFRAYANPLFMVDLRRAIYTALMKKDISYFDKMPTGVLIGRLSQDVTLLFQVYVDKLMLAIQDLAQAIGGILLSLVTMWRVAVPALGVIVLCGIIYIVGERFIDKLWNDYNNRSSTASSKAEEIITSFRTIKSFDSELHEAKSYRQALDDVNQVFNKTSVAQGVKDGLIWMLIHLMIPAILYLASVYVMDKYYGYQSGDLMILMMSFVFSSLGISLFLSLSDDFKKARVSAAKVLRILETEPNVDQDEGDALESIVGKIEFIDVGFKYETREEWAVRHLSFTINAGETVAFVGESGCGKSTTLQLLQRFYEVQEGKILIDGVDIQTLSGRNVRSFISVVPQGPVLFSMSVKDNIRFSRASATDEEVAEAARLGNAHDFIMEIPDNYEAIVQQTSLSGGQKQRICISRAILANTPILLLDEATAALDTESERLVQQSLERFRQGKTAILVAHRLATVVHADRILVFQEGHIVEEGTHKELLEKGGIYTNLVKYQLQRRAYTDKKHIALSKVFALEPPKVGAPEEIGFTDIFASLSSLTVPIYSPQQIYKYDEAVTDEDYLVELLNLREPIDRSFWDFAELVSTHMDEIRGCPQILPLLSPAIARFLAVYFYQFKADQAFQEKAMIPLQLLFFLPDDVIPQIMIIAEPYFTHICQVFVDIHRVVKDDALRASVSLFFNCFYNGFHNLSVTPACSQAISVMVDYLFGFATICWKEASNEELGNMVKAAKMIVKWRSVMSGNSLVLARFLDAAVKVFTGVTFEKIEDMKRADLLVGIGWNILDGIRALSSELEKMMDVCYKGVSKSMRFVAWVLTEYELTKDKCPRMVVPTNTGDSEVIPDFVFVGDLSTPVFEYEGMCYSQEWKDALDDNEILVYENEKVTNIVRITKDVIDEFTDEYRVNFLIDVVLCSCSLIKQMRKREDYQNSLLYIVFPMVVCQIMRTVNPVAVACACNATSFWEFLLEDQSLILPEDVDQRFLTVYRKDFWLLVRHGFLSHVSDRCVFEAITAHFKCSSVEVINSCLDSLHLIFIDAPFNFSDAAISCGLYSTIVRRTLELQATNHPNRKDLIVFLRCLLSTDCVRTAFFARDCFATFIFHQIFDYATADMFLDVIMHEFVVFDGDSLVFHKTCQLLDKFKESLSDERWQRLIAKFFSLFEHSIKANRAPIATRMQRDGLLARITSLPKVLVEANQSVFESKDFDAPPYIICNCIVGIYAALSCGDAIISKMLATDVYPAIIETFRKIELSVTIIESMLEIIFEAPVKLDQPQKGTFVRNDCAFALLVQSTQHLTSFPDILRFLATVSSSSMANKMRMYHADLPHMILDFIATFPVEEEGDSLGSRATAEAMHLFTVISQESLKVSTLFQMFHLLRPTDNKMMSWWTPYLVSIFQLFLARNSVGSRPAFFCFNQNSSCFKFPLIRSNLVKKGWSFVCNVEIEMVPCENSVSNLIFVMESRAGDCFRTYLKANGVFEFRFGRGHTMLWHEFSDKHEFKPGVWHKLTFNSSRNGFSFYIDDEIAHETQNEIVFRDDITKYSLGNVLVRQDMCLNASFCYMFGFPLEREQISAMNLLPEDFCSGFSPVERSLNSSLPACLFTRYVEDNLIFGYSAGSLSESNVCTDISTGKSAVGSCQHSGHVFEAGSSTSETIEVAGGLKLFLPLFDQVDYQIFGKTETVLHRDFLNDLINVFMYGFTGSAVLELEFIAEGGFRVFNYSLRIMNKLLLSKPLLNCFLNMWNVLHTVEHRKEMLQNIWSVGDIWLRMSEDCQVFLWEKIMPKLQSDCPAMFADVLPISLLIAYISQQPMLRVRDMMWKVVSSMASDYLTMHDLETFLMFCFLSSDREFQAQILSVFVALTEKDVRGGLVTKFLQDKGCLPFIQLLGSDVDAVRARAIKVIFFMFDRNCVAEHMWKQMVLRIVATYNSTNSGDKVWSVLVSGILVRDLIQPEASYRFSIWCGLSRYFRMDHCLMFLEALSRTDNSITLCSSPLWYFWVFYATSQSLNSMAIIRILMRKLVDAGKMDKFLEAMSFFELLFFVGYDASRLIGDILSAVLDSPLMVANDSVRDVIIQKVYNFIFMVFETERYSKNVQLLAQYGDTVESSLKENFEQISFDEYIALFQSYSKPIRRNFGCRIDESGTWHDKALAKKLVSFASSHYNIMKARNIELVVLVAAYLKKVDKHECDPDLTNWIDSKALGEHTVSIYTSFIGLTQSTDASIWLEQHLNTILQLNKTMKMEWLRTFNKIHAMRSDFSKVAQRTEYIEYTDKMLLRMKQDQRMAKNLALKAHCNLSRSLVLNGGPWCESTSLDHWRIDPRLDLAQRHILLRPNRYFSSHINASMKRDRSAQDLKQNWMGGDINQRIFDPLKEDMLERYEQENRRSEFETEARMISMCANFDGKFYLTSTEIIFDGEQLNNSLSHVIDGSTYKTVVFKLRDVTWVLWRSYIHVDQGLEFFLQNGRSYFFFFNGNERKDIIRFISNLKLPNLKILQKVKSKDLIADLKLTNRWMSGDLSTYEYLMLINLFAGRSVNDLSQYPVFPWILKDYTSEVLNIEDPSIYRDLSKPVGALNERRLTRLKEDMDKCPESYAKCLYRSHYSTAYNVLHFMIRVEPFTTMHIQMQDGRFDNPNRLFKSISRSHHISCDSMANDYRELIPELFTFPDFLINGEHFDLGVEPSDVALPAWADSPDDFIVKHRMALESDYVASHINEWIDLVFGVKQRGEAALEANNVFHAFCYSDIMTDEVKSDQELLDAVRRHALSFGIIPEQVFYSPHPPRPREVTLMPQRVHIPEFQKVVSVEKTSFILVFAPWHDGSLRIVTNTALLSFKDGELKRQNLPYHIESPQSIALADKPAFLITRDKTMYGFHVHAIDSLSLVFSHRQKFAKFLKFLPIGNAVVSVDEDGTTLLWRLLELGRVPVKYRVNHHFTRTIDAYCSKLLGLGASFDIHRQIVLWDLLSGTYIRSFQVSFMPSRVLLVDSGFIVLFHENPSSSKESCVEVYALNNNRLLSTFNYPSAVTSVEPMNFRSGLSLLAVAFADNRLVILTMPRSEIWISASFDSSVLSMHFDALNGVLYMSSAHQIVSLTI